MILILITYLTLTKLLRLKYGPQWKQPTFAMVYDKKADENLHSRTVQFESGYLLECYNLAFDIFSVPCLDVV